MRYFRNWYIIFLIGAILITTTESCGGHKRFKRMLKHRRSITMKRYHSPYQRRFKKKVQPINKNYIIKGGYRYRK